MRIAILPAVLLCLGCVAPQSESASTVAAYDIPLASDADRVAFLSILRREAAVSGYHVDAASDEELRAMSSISPIRLSAAIWRGNDVEIVALAMDMVDHLGRVWIVFPKGQNPSALARFRVRLMAAIKRRWPQTASLPIMPSGAIPLATDLIRTPSGYIVKPGERAKYDPPVQ